MSRVINIKCRMKAGFNTSNGEKFKENELLGS